MIYLDVTFEDLRIQARYVQDHQNDRFDYQCVFTDGYTGKRKETALLWEDLAQIMLLLLDPDGEADGVKVNYERLEQLFGDDWPKELRPMP